jgi:prevent-host-death family protein
MAEIGIKQLKENASRVVDEVERGASYLVTKRGRPSAVLLPIEEAEDLVLANAKELLAIRKRARSAYRRGRTRRLEDLG